MYHYSKLPLEIWLEIAESCCLGSKFNLALCNQDLWNNINRYIKPFDVFKHYHNKHLNLNDRSFRWLSLVLLLKHLPNHISCPSCQWLHPIVLKPDHYYVNQRHKIKQPTCYCETWLTWTKSRDFQIGINIASGKWLLWSEGRLIMEQLRIGNSKPLERLNERTTTLGYWMNDPYGDRQDCKKLAQWDRPFNMRWSSHATFLVVDNHLMMREVNQTVAIDNQSHRMVYGLTRPGDRRRRSSGFSAPPCQHDSENDPGLYGLVASLRKQARTSGELAREDQYCAYCTTGSRFTVQQIKSCPKSSKSQCQQVTMVRWIDFGDFSSPANKNWKKLTHITSRARPYLALLPYRVKFHGKSIVNAFEKALASDTLHDIGASEELPLEFVECRCVLVDRREPCGDHPNLNRELGRVRRWWRSLWNKISHRSWGVRDSVNQD